ncbi:MAG: ABC transporter permease [Clostridiales bacterium]|nr:ABC transporter permease [Clostridiales bacterium]
MNEEKLDGLQEETLVENAEAETQTEQQGFLSDNVKALSPSQLVMKRFFRSKLSIVGLVLIIGLFLFSFIGPLFSPYGETEIDYDTDRMNVVVTEFTYEVPMYDEFGQPVLDENGELQYETYTVYQMDKTAKKVDDHALPSSEHWFGTDADGMDVLTRLMYGGRISLTISFIVVFMEVILGVILGGLAGYFGKWVDTLIMRIVDIFNCLPSLPLMLIIGAILDALGIKASVRIYYMMAFLTFFGWTGIARIVRGQILSLREQEFMVSATARGLSTKRKIFSHLIPNVMPQLIVSMTLGLGSVILSEATLSYLNLGVPKPYAAWGGMIGDIKDPIILQNYPNLWIPAGLCIVLAVLAFNFIGDGLRDAFDPKSKK